jgi:lipopolysaccharide transport system permease protein
MLPVISLITGRGGLSVTTQAPRHRSSREARPNSSGFEVVIRPRRGWQAIDWRELWHHRELLGFLVWRDVKIRYKQTALGSLWAVLQPLLAMLIFCGLFSRVVTIATGGPPYALFVFAGLVPWTFFANALTLSSTSLVGNEQMIRKTYFPRLFIPLGTIFALGLDLLVGLGFMGLLLVYYHWVISPTLLWLPVFLMAGVLATTGAGLVLAALNVYFRDIKYVVPFAVQMAFFLTPVIYPLSRLPARLRTFVALNPMTGVIEGFRHALLGIPAAWGPAVLSLGVSATWFVAGLFAFRRMERDFADVV